MVPQEITLQYVQRYGDASHITVVATHTWRLTTRGIQGTTHGRQITTLPVMMIGDILPPAKITIRETIRAAIRITKTAYVMTHGVTPSHVRCGEEGDLSPLAATRYACA